MLAESSTGCQSRPASAGDWRAELARAYTDSAALLAALDIEPARIPDLAAAPGAFRLLVPRGYAAQMAAGDPDDPLLRQVLPLGAEGRTAPGFITDPVADAAARRGPALLQKYRGRALLIAHAGCAVHCRYCFRRHFDYTGGATRAARLDAAVNTIARDDSITEVILSGGDPLLLGDAELAGLIGALSGLPRLRRLRLHTRIPVVLPSRVNEPLCLSLADSRLATSVVIHANHPRELSADCAAALGRLRAAGPALLNQSVLLAGVNDDERVLAQLSEALFEHGVLPYYLHQLDPVSGAAHFQVEDRRAVAIRDALAERLPGYLVPRLVREIPGAPAKLPVVAESNPAANREPAR